ncbi:family 43 glycosylhydrolase [Mucisphaera sp.]|uniref:family 43 glycosylhydrolase n=1 Tax=Mucisphaera sp. TaxID=2913024 RepID=UPI003D0E2C42
MIANIHNTEPRVDIHGDIIDAHDGCLRQFEGRFYLYGTGYEDTDGFTPANRYVVYSSPDLENWTPHGDLLTKTLEGVGYRPYVVYNPATEKYVLWFNWYPVLWEGHFGVAIADNPEGPFEMVQTGAEVAMPQPGDHNVFVDEDGTGYLIYTSIMETPDGHHHMSVDRLDESLTASTKENSGTFAAYVEAPAMYRHNGYVYTIFGKTCCFCPAGANAEVYRAETPMGPWQRVGEINRAVDGRIIVPGQQTDIATIQTPDGPQHIWMADLWGSRPDGIKGHDIQHWEPLILDDTGLPRSLTNASKWSIELPDSVEARR